MGEIFKVSVDPFEPLGTFDLAAHDKRIREDERKSLLLDVEEIIVRIMYCNNQEIGKYIKVEELRAELEELASD